MPPRPALRLALFYAAAFGLVGVQLPFWPVWLASRGLSAVEIGLLMAVGQWLRTATTPLAGILADGSRDRRRVMLLLAMGGLAAFLLCLPPRGFLALLALNAASGASLAALVPLGDQSALAVAREGRLDYGRTRLWGTVAFIAATLLGGNLLAGRDPDIILYLLIATAALLLGACAALPGAAAPGRPSLRAAARHLLAPRQLGFIAAATLIQASHAVYYLFGTLRWQALGFSDATIAWLWAEGAIAEIALFFWGAPLLRRLGPLGLVALGGAGGVLRWTVTALTGALPVLALVQLLHALTFGATHLGTMHFLARSTPPEHAATSQTVYAAVSSGLGFGLMNLAAGALYASLAGGAYLAMGASAGAGALLALLLARGGRVPPAIKS